ncbi:MAG: hypothetical protein LBS42_10660 [Tannerella sp.]|jgi:hypothetical protein|nr:hypothetical protein [Tannerella sp.]
MKKKNIIQRTILIMMALIAIAAGVSYFVLEREKPWMAFYVACCGGVLIINLVIILIFVRKNIK